MVEEIVTENAKMDTLENLVNFGISAACAGALLVSAIYLFEKADYSDASLASAYALFTGLLSVDFGRSIYRDSSR